MLMNFGPHGVSPPGLVLPYSSVLVLVLGFHWCGHVLSSPGAPEVHLPSGPQERLFPLSADQADPLYVVLIKSTAVLTLIAVNTVWFSLLISILCDVTFICFNNH